jgi:large subunit ribosomal protein L25
MEYTLTATQREGLGTGKVKKLRVKGFVPGVLYGEGKTTQHISVNAHDFGMLIMRGGAGKLINLKIAGGTSEVLEHVLIKEYQRHPVKGNFLHVDLLRVVMDHLINVKVSVHLFNEEKRQRDGAILEVLMHEMEISCLPGNIPDRIDIDVADLAIGSGIHIRDLNLPEGVKAVSPPEEIVVLASAPTGAEAVAAPVSEEAEPEVAVKKEEA